uniref:hypothetical protein n=1 Tax=[Ruminococcus] lactaris TaxID=46228 RepID=UPI00242CCAF1
NACIFKTVFEILFGGYATPTKCVAFWRLALNSYIIFMLISGRIVGVRSTEQSVGIKVGGF